MISQAKGILKFVKVKSNAFIPTKATDHSAGLDLYACLEKDLIITSGELIKIPCGISLEIPQNYAGFIFARSGLGINYGIIPSNAVGVIDSDYRGEIQVGLCKISKDMMPYVIHHGDRIAQLVIIKVESFILQEVDDLSKTLRGDNGFGSSGK